MHLKDDGRETELYSRRFYSSQRARNTPVIQTVTPKKHPDTTVQSAVTDTHPRWADAFSEDDFIDRDEKQVDPRDFVPASGGVSAVAEVRCADDERHEITPSGVTESPVENLKNMTFEDMMLTWLAYLGSSGEYDDEVFIILGLILMIGA